MKMKILYIVMIMTMVLQRTYAVCEIKRHILDCCSRNITSANLSSALNVNPTHAITRVLLNDNNIMEINTDVFRKFENLEVIDLSENKIQFITDNAFRGVPKLHTIFLKRNNLSTIPTKAIKLRSLRNLNLDGNEITLIKNYSFHGNRLKNISIKGNKLHSVEINAFANLKFVLSTLSVRRNRLTRTSLQAIRQLYHLKNLDIADNKIDYLPKDAFKDMPFLEKVELFSRFSFKIRVHPDAFRNMESLKQLNLNSESLQMSEFPNLTGTNNIRVLRIRGIENLVMASNFCKEKTQLKRIQVQSSTMSTFPRLGDCKSLNSIDFYDNEIGTIPKNAVSGLKFIEDIKIIQFNDVKEIHRDAFTFLPSLKELDLSHFPLGLFPNLTGTTHLQSLTLQGCKINFIPTDVCKDLRFLEKLNLAENRIKTVPSLTGCEKLEDITFYRNNIISVHGVFKGLKELEYVDLSDNHIVELGESAFQSNERLHNLNLSRNMLSKIHEEVFKDTKSIEVLDISKNYDLVYLPSKHLRSLRKITIEGNKKMINFPTQEDLPRVRQLSLVYEYHCCFFLKKVQQISRKYRVPSKQSTWKVLTGPRSSKYTSNITKRQTIDMDKIEPLLREMNNGTTIIFPDPKSSNKGVRFSEYDYLDEAYCTPQPNAFYPCDDLMGKEWLRICVWVVFLFSLCGNIAVLVVSLCNCNKIDVPRYLILNLSFADLCLSIYLGFLSFVDIKTIGDFRSHALDWQFSGSCKAAGFLAVFAAELSVYTLVAITIERFTTIKNSMHVHRRISMKQAVFITFIGWVVSITLAALPLQTLNGVKFSDYSKYSVCLPFEVEQTSSKIYVIIILVLNILGFLIILVCYVQIYFHIRGSNAWNSGDMRVARRMAILVFTDLFCWFPIVLTALCAIFHQSILSNLWMSKVLTVFVFPLNACANPFLYAILTKQFRKDVSSLAKKIKEKSPKNRSYRMSILKMPLKGSFTYSSSVRRGSSCSFLFTRRWSSKTAEEIKFASREADLQRNGCNSENYVQECEERLTTV